MRCLAKAPEQRPASTDELRAELLACTDAGGWSDARRHEWWEQRRPRIREHRYARPVSGTLGVLTTRLPEQANSSIRHPAELPVLAPLDDVRDRVAPERGDAARR